MAADSAPIAAEHIRKQGEHFRVADADWHDPMDSSYSKRSGGRWNSPGSFGVLYLNENEQTARDFVDYTLFAGLPYGPEDLSTGPVLASVEVPNEQFVDAATPLGLRALGLPDCYPRATPDADDIVPHVDCQPIGQRLYEAGERGVACRAANTPDGRGSELAWFDQAGVARLVSSNTRDFVEWYWGYPGSAG